MIPIIPSPGPYFEECETRNRQLIARARIAEPLGNVITGITSSDMQPDSKAELLQNLEVYFSKISGPPPVPPPEEPKIDQERLYKLWKWIHLYLPSIGAGVIVILGGVLLGVGAGLGYGKDAVIGAAIVWTGGSIYGAAGTLLGGKKE
jgi:hypothetical protein